jgi:uncharacterized protein
LSSLPYVVPFAVVIALLGLHPILPLSPLAEQVVWILVMTVTLAVMSRPVLDFRIRNWFGSLALGVAVFVLWVAPDRIFPGYHNFWLFTNPLTGSMGATLPEASRSDALLLILRTARAALFVPIAEELFWRAWLMRWIISPHFAEVKLGAWSARAFWIVAVLFAAEHGPLWDVGLAAGILYNWWMVRTKSVGDLILAHAVTNACVSAYVVLAGQWGYWP